MKSLYYVYVLYSKAHHRYYVGSSSDPTKRLLSHNDPRNNGWTKRFRPWTIIYTETFNSKLEALKRERWFKSGVGREFMKSMHNN
jgi:putative endonuclease